MRGVAQTVDSSGRTYAYGKNPAAAVLLSFFLPAIGQMYNGDVKKCFAMWGGFLVASVLTALTGGFLVVLGLGVWVWSMVDAYNVASRKSPIW